jgi:hypothetical protein
VKFAPTEHVDSEPGIKKYLITKDRFMSICVVKDPETNEFITLKPGDVLHIGRREVEGGRNLIFKQTDVSGNHAQIKWVDTHWAIEDLDSANCTTVNGCPLKPNENKRLFFNNYIRIAKYPLWISTSDFDDPSPENDQLRQQDLTGIAVSETVFVKQALRRRANGVRLDENDISKNPEYLFLLVQLSTTVRQDFGNIYKSAEWGHIAGWNSRSNYQYEDENFKACAAQACKTAIKLQSKIQDFNQSFPMEALISEITMSTKPVAVNITAPYVLLDNPNVLTFDAPKSESTDGHIIVADQLTSRIAGEFAQFEPIVQDANAENESHGLFRLLSLTSLSLPTT